MTSEIYFSLARISCIHIFRAAGIDRCSPQLLDAVTDIVIRHLMLLASKCSRNAELSGRNSVEIQDLALAMEQIGSIYPRCILDPFDADPNGIKGFSDFIDWAKGPVPDQVRRLSKQAMPDPVIATGTVQFGDKEQENGDEKSSENAKQTDWLSNLSRKRAKIGQEKRFKGTVLSGLVGEEDDEDTSEIRIAGGPLSIDEFYEKMKSATIEVMESES
jgi:histone H3/H4